MLFLELYDGVRSGRPGNKIVMLKRQSDSSLNKMDQLEFLALFLFFILTALLSCPTFSACLHFRTKSAA